MSSLNVNNERAHVHLKHEGACLLPSRRVRPAKPGRRGRPGPRLCSYGWTAKAFATSGRLLAQNFQIETHS